MTIDCFICNIALFDGFVTCLGYCKRVVHFGCARISKEAYVAICKHAAVKWFCVDCNSVDLSSITKNYRCWQPQLMLLKFLIILSLGLRSMEQ